MPGLHIVESKAAKWNRERERLWDESANDPQAQALEKELQLLDPRLIVRFIWKTPPGTFKVGCHPERWHIIRKGEFSNQTDYYLPIIGPNGEYRNPEMKVAEDMKAADLWKEGRLDELFKRREKQERKRELDISLRSEQRNDEFAEAYRAAKRVKSDERVLKET